MSYILTVSYFPINASGAIVCQRRIFVRYFTKFVDVKRKLRYLNRTVRVVDYYIEERPAKV